MSEPLHDLKERTNIYQRKEDQSKELQSTGQILIGFGIIGLLFIIASISGILPFGFGGTMKYVQYGIMGLLFLVFLVMGIQSRKNAKIAKKEAKAENKLSRELKGWFLEHYTSEHIDRNLDLSSPEEELYYERTIQMKSLLESEFGELDSDYLDFLTDELYQSLYED